MKHLASLVATLCALLVSTSPFAQGDPFARGFDTVPLKPTPAFDSGIALEGARTWAAKSYRVGLLFDSSLNVLALREGSEKLGNLIPWRLDAHLLAAYQVHERVEVGLDLPLVLYQSDNFGLLANNGFPQQGVYSLFRPCDDPLQTGCGLGDVRLVTRVQLLDPDHAPVGLAITPEVRLPLGDGSSFTGDRGFTFAPRAAVERSFGPVRVLANVGYRFRPAGQFLNLYVGNEFAFGAGAIYRLPDLGPVTRIDAIGEMHLATPTGAPFTFDQSDSLKTPWNLLLGVRGRVHQRWGVELSVGRGIGIESGYGREDFRVLAGIRYEAEFHDRDGDGIADDVDRCPDVREDDDGFEDSDGCPDPDNDQDGVPDSEDACMSEPGSRELDGCPDMDQDEVPDNVDECPEQAGPPENGGCPFTDPPFVEIQPERLRLKANVLFETAQAKIQKQSFPILDEVAKVLNEHPEVGPITIEGHTDNRGGRRYNIDLSARRARAVLEYLVKKGVDRKRLRAKGFGFDRPIATNDTALGRAKNRRVDFIIVKDEVMKPVAAPSGE
jgi:OmpA-OmpF porin, OOP family